MINEKPEIKETIEGLKEIRQGHIDDDCEGNCIQVDFLSQAIEWGKALDQAEGELKKKESFDHFIDSRLKPTAIEYYNQAIDIARPILAKAKLRMEELEID